MYASNGHKEKDGQSTETGRFSAFASLQAWWKRSSDTERRETIATSGWISAAAIGVVSLFAFVPGQYTEHRAAADYAQTVATFADQQYGDSVVKTADNSLLEQEWLSKVSEQVSSDDWNPVLELDRLNDYVEGFETLNVSATRSLYDSAEYAVNEHICLATAIYYEARSESLQGQLAVAEVIANRVADHRYPNTICDVVYQGSRRNIGCQFTFTCDGALARKPKGVRWQRAKSVAAHVVLEINEELTNGATHYHADYVDPIWNAGLVRTDKIGTHIFYRFPRGKEWGVYRARLAEKRSNRLRVVKAVTDTDTPKTDAVMVSATSAPAP